MKKLFVPFLILLIILTVTSFVLNEDYTDNSRFNPAAACFFVSIFFLFLQKTQTSRKKTVLVQETILNNILKLRECSNSTARYATGHL